MVLLEILGMLFIVLWLLCGLAAYDVLVKINPENKTLRVFCVNVLLGMVALGTLLYLAAKPRNDRM